MRVPEDGVGVLEPAHLLPQGHQLLLLVQEVLPETECLSLPLHRPLDYLLGGLLQLSVVLQGSLQHSSLVHSLLAKLLVVLLQPDNLSQQGSLEALLELVKHLGQLLEVDVVFLTHLLEVSSVCSLLSPNDLARLAYNLTACGDSRPDTAAIDIDGSKSDSLRDGRVGHDVVVVVVVSCFPELGRSNTDPL